MKKFKTLKIDDRIVNKYLSYKNLEINRIYSSSKKKSIKTIITCGGSKSKKIESLF